MKRLGIPALIVIVLAAAGAGAWYFIHRNAESGQLRLLTAELAYLTNLQTILKAHPNPEAQSSASVFISAASINSALAGANGLSVPLSNSEHAQLRVAGIEAQFKDGFPEVIARVEISRQNPEILVKAELTGVLEPQLDKADPAKLLFFLRPLYVRLEGQNASKDQLSVADRILSDLAQNYASKLPHIDVSLAKDFSVAFAATQVPLPVPTQAGKLNGELDIPGLSFHSSLALSGLLFLADGVHLYVSSTQISVPSVSAVLLPYQVQTDVKSYTSADELKSVSNQKQAAIDSIRQSIATPVSTLKVSGSDFRVWISKDLLSQVANVFNSLPDAERRVHFHTLSEEGQIYRAGGGGLGCGGYAELVGGNSANANLQVGNLTPTWSEGKGFTEAADFKFAFDAQVTGHVNGPAGPHPTWVLNCVHIPWPINKDACTNLPSVTVSCETPVGGGIGLGSYGIHGDRTERLTAGVTLRSDNSSWLIYEMNVASPDQVPITIEVGLGQLGTLGLPFNFPVPHQPLLTGKAPLLFDQSGVISDPASGFSKKYSITAVPSNGTVGKDGYAATGSLKIEWQ